MLEDSPDPGPRTPDPGPRTPDPGPRTPDPGPRTPDQVWGTVGCERTVLVVARTLTSTVRLLEAIELFRGDPRIWFRFTTNDTTSFHGGVRDQLAAAGVGTLVPWSEAASTPCDLVLTASENIDFADVAAHAIVLPHGLGFNKYVPTADGTSTRLAGLPPAEVLHAGRATIVLSHPDQRDQLLAACPASAGRTVVVGDPLLDRMRASLPLRGRYRAALGAGSRTLVLVASTWGPASMFGHDRELFARLLRELPFDDYQVCAVLHPNVWAWYGPAQIRLWLATELDSGLVLLPPHNGWQAALVAADQVITDHGSLGLFAAALDRPVLLTGTTDETVPGTPVADLAQHALWLDGRADLRQQLDDSRSRHQQGQFTDIVERVFAHVGRAADRLRTLVLEHLTLAPLDGDAAMLRIPDPDTAGVQHPNSFAVHTTDAPDGSLSMVRHPAPVWRHRPGGPPHHLVCEESETDLRLRERAAVLTNARTFATVDEATHWTIDALTAYPGAQLAVARTPHHHIATLRDGNRVTVETTSTDVDLVASAVQHRLRHTQDATGTLVVRSGPITATLTIRADSGADL